MVERSGALGGKAGMVKKERRGARGGREGLVTEEGKGSVVKEEERGS